MGWPEYDHGLPHRPLLWLTKCWLSRYQLDHEFAATSWIYFSWSTNKQMVWMRILSNIGLTSSVMLCGIHISLGHQGSGLGVKSPASECLCPSSNEGCRMGLQFLGACNAIGYIDIQETLRFCLLRVSRWSDPGSGRPEAPSCSQLWWLSRYSTGNHWLQTCVCFYRAGIGDTWWRIQSPVFDAPKVVGKWDDLHCKCEL